MAPIRHSGCLVLLLAALSLGDNPPAYPTAPAAHPNDWPTAFTCQFTVRRNSDWKVVNSGKYVYNWTATQRMLITNTNCTGGSPPRTDLHCDALHRDGNLYSYGMIDSTPWCCFWHNFGPTPPDWRHNATLVNASTSFSGIPAAKYVLTGVPSPTSPTRYFYQALDSSMLPLAYENGEGETFVYSGFSFRPIEPSVFDFPSATPQCNGKCPWATTQGDFDIYS